MALTVDGVPVSGSTGANTYSRNRYGSYRRRRVVPVNPNTARQNGARSAFRGAVAAWGSILSQLQRDQWNNWAATTPWLNKAGQAVFLTGQAAFIRHSCAWQTAGNAITGNWLLAPPQNDVGSIDVSKVNSEIEIEISTQTTGAVEIAAPASTNSSGVANGGFFVEITPGQNAGRKFPGSKWSSLQVAGSNPVYAWAGGVIDLGGLALSLPWSFSLGQYVWLRFRGIGDVTDGTPERRVTTQAIVGPLKVVVVPP